MSRYERHGQRSLVYSKWHRLYLDDDATMIDLDGIEYCSTCRTPLVLLETACDVGQDVKPATVLGSLGRLSNVLTLAVLYTVDPRADMHNGCLCEPAASTVDPFCSHGIIRFRVRRVWPQPPDTEWRVMTPDEFRERLQQVRQQHGHLPRKEAHQ